MDKTTKQHQKYVDKSGREVVGVTTVLSMLDKPALYRWYYKQGKLGLDPFKMKDKAATIGTIAHYLVECHLKGEKPTLDDYSKSDIDKAETAFLAYLDFEKNNHLAPIDLELQMVSNDYGYGGTCDIYATLNDKKALIDLKTSSGVWPEHRVQLAAYRNLLAENGKPVETVHLLRIDKESGEFNHHTIDSLDNEWEFFKALLLAYKLRQKMGWK